MPGLFEAILELLVLPVGPPGTLDSFRDVQQNCAEQQRRADRADDEITSDIRGGVDGRGAFIWGVQGLPRHKPGDLGQDSNYHKQCGKPTPEGTPVMPWPHG
jgi:hypothetical protein